MKTCLDCCQAKELSEFYRSKGGKQGVASYCKICNNARRSARHAADPEPGRVRAAAWKVANPEWARANDARWYAENKEHANARCANYYQENKSAMRASNRKWREENAEAISAAGKRYRAENKDQVKVLRRAEYERNKARYIANARRHEMNRAKAFPDWADKVAIAALYDLRDRLTEETGVLHHVDHVVPLQGKSVCGLHVHYNMRVITATENRAKGNRLIEE